MELEPFRVNSDGKTVSKTSLLGTMVYNLLFLIKLNLSVHQSLQKIKSLDIRPLAIFVLEI